MRRTIALLALLPVMLAAGGAAAQQAELKKMNVASAFAATTTLPLWIADNEGLFRKHGLDVKLILFQGSAQATQALLGGSADIVFGTASAAVTAAGRGAPTAIVATTSLIDYMLVVRPTTTSADQLRGKSLGISNFSGGDDFALIRLLPKLGLTYKQDVKFVVLGTPNPYQKVEAVLNGTTDGTLATFEVVETLKVQGKQTNTLAELIASGVKSSTGDIYTTRSYISRNGEDVKRFLRAFSEAIRLAKNDKDVTFATLKKHTNTKNDTVLEKLYVRTVVNGFQDMPYPIDEAIIAVRDDMADTGGDLAKLRDMGIEKFVDNAPMKALEQEGFFAKLPPRKVN
ncbi:MAG: ABC transporter substrate-binding protein [Rhodospirillales bacterium]